MAVDYLPGAQLVSGGSGGTWAYDVPDKLLLHTTEGDTIEGAVSAYRASNCWPHFTCDPLLGRLVQHIPMSRSAMALYNGPQAMETNRAGSVIQVEIVGRAARTHLYTDAWYQWLAINVVRPICLERQIPARITRFYGAMDGTIAIESWPGRFQDDRWNWWHGILGHQNAGDGNDHWDPGKLNQDKILMFAFGGGEVYDPITRQSWRVGSGTWSPQAGPIEGDNDLTPDESKLLTAMGGVLTPIYPPFGRAVSLADIYDSAAKNFGQLHQSQAVTNTTLANIAALLGSIDKRLAAGGATSPSPTAEEIAVCLIEAFRAKLA